jgi:adenosine deaminase
MQNFDPFYNSIPKAEIHCHLEGSIRTATILDVAREYGLALPAWTEAELNPHVRVYNQMKDLQAVLDAFAIAQATFAAPAVVERVAAELFEDAHRQNVRLFEVRFSPDWAFKGHHLDWDACLLALLRSQERAEREYGMAIGLIAITSRGLGAESCSRTVDWAIRWKEHIQGIDLADGERLYPIEDFVAPVWKGKDAGLKVTVHSGEDTPAAYVVETIRRMSPERIGHGIHVIEDLAAVEFVRKAGVTLETNPWSNYLTNSVARIEDHPLKRLFDLGVKVTINSDDPELLDTNLNNEYRIAHEILGMSLQEIAACNHSAVESSFLSEAKKAHVGI